MGKQSQVFRGWKFFLFLAFLVIPLLGWTAYAKASTRGTRESSRAAEIVASQSTSARESPSSSVERGRELFMGYVHFQNDGPPCMGCHSIGSNGILGGGAMGPDLTNVSTRRSPEEIASILSNGGSMISPVMQPIFTEHALTPSEQADLIAFLNSSVGQPQSNREIVVIGISLAGFIAVVALIGFVYRRRLRGVRKPLLKRSLAEKQ